MTDSHASEMVIYLLECCHSCYTLNKTIHEDILLMEILSFQHMSSYVNDPKENCYRM